MSTHNAPTPEAHAQAARTRIARKARQVAGTFFLDGGAKVYPDTAPGIGIVLEFKSRKCYFATSDLAVKMWYGKYMKDFGDYSDQGDVKGALKDPKVSWEDYVGLGNWEGAKVPDKG